MIAGGAADGRVLRGSPEEAQGRDGAIGRLRAGDPAALYADGIGGEREANGRDARELLRGPAVGSEAVGGGGAFPEEVEGAVLQRIEEGGGVGGDAPPRAPGVVGEATPEGQGENGGDRASNQKLYSTPI